MKAPRKPLTFDLSATPATEEEIVRTAGIQEPPKPLSVPRQQLGVRIPVDLYKRLRVKAVMDGVLVQDIVERAVRDLLDREAG